MLPKLKFIYKTSWGRNGTSFPLRFPEYHSPSIIIFFFNIRASLKKTHGRVEAKTQCVLY